MQRPSPDPQRLAPAHQPHANQERSEHDRSLDPKTLLRALLRRPRHLEVADDEPAQCARVAQPRAHLAARLRVAVEAVAADGSGGDHDAEHVEAPAHARGHVGPPGSRQALADEHKADNHEGHGEGDGAQAHLGLKVAPVGADVLLGKVVVQPVADDLTEQNGDDGGEVKVADLQDPEAVEGPDKDGEGRVYADYPGEGLNSEGL